ncbi:hypothetical protein HPB47_010803 [Ixodes persulcatus]|uniref:Uncharacterized protein n=1 Tax=Ixodes persulcatus TaxID=34615 RepID=A0AC60NY37_IXOPE|nr:hypothetical protein HPB47_010803 [Ixodes persulcatus]
MGAALRNLEAKKKTQGEALGGSGKLTPKKIQNYYGYALRSNSNDVPGIKRAAKATLHHMTSNRALASCESPPPHKSSLPDCVRAALETGKPIATSLGFATGNCLERRSVEKDSLRLRKPNAVHQNSSSAKEECAKRYKAGAAQDYSPGQL